MTMEHVSTFFKIENDIFYKLGFEKGREKVKIKIVKNLLTQTDYSIAKIASLAVTTEAFVEKIKQELQ